MASFNSDNCSVMKGQRNGLIAKLKEVNPRIVDIGCCCHLANLAVSALLKELPLNNDELLLDVSSHFRLGYYVITKAVIPSNLVAV